MSTDHARETEDLLRGLCAALATSLQQANHLLELFAGSHADERQPGKASRSPVPVDLVDETAFTVRWRSKECFLGYSIPFRVMRLLASHPGQYVTVEQLLDEAWGGTRSASAVRTAISGLRAKLIASGMAPLAAAIDGSNSGHYALCLDRIPAPKKIGHKPDSNRTEI